MDSENTLWNYDFEKEKDIKPGSLLLSEPFMFDENFRRTVVLVCEHTEPNGTVGIIVNKPIDLRLQEVVEDFPQFNGKLFLGGPVGTDTLQFIHSLGDKIEGSIKLSEKLYWGGNFDQLKSLIAEGQVAPYEVNFYLGYSGWSSAQLETELKDNSWIIAQATPKHIFHSDYSKLWKMVMKEMGGVYNTMAGYPENPMLN
ncbi:MAG: YqgE/AlgH family protein [Chitinophagales bacterium]